MEHVANSSESLFRRGDLIDGKYEIHHLLGQGGFGQVYLAHDRKFGGAVALKTFRDVFLRDEQARQAFRREALLWIGLDEHPCILSRDGSPSTTADSS